MCFLKLNVFGSIRHTLQPSKLLHKLEDRSAKGLCVGIDPAGYEVLALQSKLPDVARTVKVFDGKFLSNRGSSNSWPLRRRGTNTLNPTPARLEDSRDSPQGSRERRCTADDTHAKKLQLQEVGLATTVTNTLDNEGDP